LVEVDISRDKQNKQSYMLGLLCKPKTPKPKRET